VFRAVWQAVTDDTAAKQRPLRLAAGPALVRGRERPWWGAALKTVEKVLTDSGLPDIEAATLSSANLLFKLSLRLQERTASRSARAAQQGRAGIARPTAGAKTKVPRISQDASRGSGVRTGYIEFPSKRESSTRSTHLANALLQQ
jgi:hypothetical protein